MMKMMMNMMGKKFIREQSNALTPLYVANNKYESWNGEVPNWVTDDGQQFLIGLDQEG